MRVPRNGINSVGVKATRKFLKDITLKEVEV
jgi:hypothetical protein